MSNNTGRKPDPLYDGIAKLRRENRRRVLGVLLLIVGLSLLAVALFRQSMGVAILGAAAVASAR